MLTAEEVNGMLVSQLKEELKARGQPTTGKKAELSARLLEYIHDSVGDVEEQDENKVESGDKHKAADATASEHANSTSDEPQQSKVQGAAGTTSTEPVDASGEDHTNDHHKGSVQSDMVVSSPSPAAGAVQDADTQHVAREQNDQVPQTHVRIDNFQRPLNPRALREWIEAQAGCKVAPDGLWINSIKTHCYVDFETHEDAQRCIQKVTGQKYPNSSPYTLAADFTTVSAKEAPTAPEAAHKPGEWKEASAQSNAPTVDTIAVNIDATEKGTVSSPRLSGQLSPNTATVGSKRRIEETVPEEGAVGSPVTSPTAASTAAGQQESGGGKARRVIGGLDIFRRAAAGILLGKPGAGGVALGSVGRQPGQPSENTPTVVGQIDWQQHRPDYADEGSAKGLDDLFRKTATARPALYWLPAPDEVVQQRLKDRLKSRGVLTSKK
jgi:hypothetical protein